MTRSLSASGGAPSYPNQPVQIPSEPMRFLTIAEVARRLNVSTRTVSRWISGGDLVVHRIGGVVRIAEGDLLAFLAAHRGDEP